MVIFISETALTLAAVGNTHAVEDVSDRGIAFHYVTASVDFKADLVTHGQVPAQAMIAAEYPKPIESVRRCHVADDSGPA